MSEWYLYQTSNMLQGKSRGTFCCNGSQIIYIRQNRYYLLEPAFKFLMKRPSPWVGQLHQSRTCVLYFR